MHHYGIITRDPAFGILSISKNRARRFLQIAENWPKVCADYIQVRTVKPSERRKKIGRRKGIAGLPVFLLGAKCLLAKCPASFPRIGCRSELQLHIRGLSTIDSLYLEARGAHSTSSVAGFLFRRSKTVNPWVRMAKSRSHERTFTTRYCWPASIL